MVSIEKDSGGLPTWLFVAYGGGHIAMLLPVAQRVRELGLARPLMLALTTAEAVSRQAGLETVGFADFAGPDDGEALQHGALLAAQLPTSPVHAAQSTAYLGLSYADLQASLGKEGAAQAYAQYGRQCFHPLPTMRRILRTLAPSLLVTTNSPRAERAAVEAARELGIPAACLVDLFAVDEKVWIGRPGYADRVCVLNEQVRQMFIDEGRAPADIVVTGNPGFDRLQDPQVRQAAAGVRQALAPGGEKLVLYAPSPEPLHHPVRQQAGNEQLPHEVLAALLAWAQQRPSVRVAVRPHPSQREEFALGSSQAVLAGQDMALEPLLHASDAVCITVSTVGLQAHLAGKPVVQVGGSMFDDGAPFSAMGIATAATLATLGPAMDRALATAAVSQQAVEPSTPRVIQVLRELANL